MSKSVPDRLKGLGKIYQERNALYGSNYKNFGKILMGMFPLGIELKDEEQFNRFALFLQLVHKISRYARNIQSGGHQDSLDDLAVYAQMMAEYDDDLHDEREDPLPDFPPDNTFIEIDTALAFGGKR